ncbi:ABC transporter substrate-binding protein [Rathayibacter sp. VKM Ac-2856]|uniref:ABC transporter substrate-binding protein n=1 Tax=unclassified Rathayibacter TaxID=2609250 RepID=UPI00156403EF|nr:MULTISPECIES: ABC transporter substrate-binding protein [unclassified Rathayibacter]NQX06592.1 ABC transporter substrate-binding protein [Rathayibacter sp. VKM Ac-2858]NQX21759.1 ABC transporter substrate-binding protein [Rathayibacter sp. VKM Ac-2856]
MTFHRSRPLRRSGTATAALALASALALSACSGASGAGTAADDATPVDGGRLSLAFFPDNAAFSCVDPFQTYWIEHRTVIRNVADSLTDQDPETGEIQPWLATEWSVNDAGTEYTFDLRTDVTFSDGTPFTAESVKTSFDNDEATLAELPSAYGGVYLAGYSGTEVVDADTVKVVFSTPNAAFLQGTSTTNLAILAASSYEKTPEERCLGGIVGSGPFTLTGYTPGTGITLDRRSGYAWGSALRENTGEAHLDGIDISYVAEDSVRVGQLTSDEIDIAWPRNPISENDQAVITGSGDTVERRSLPGPASNYYPNVAEGRILSDERVRQAVQKAIDRETYATTVFGADYPAATSIYDTTTPFYTDESSKLAFDAEGASELLDEAGWELGDDGYRSKDGRRLTLSVPIVTQFGAGDQLIQDQLKQVGIELELNVITNAQRADVLNSGDYDLISTYYTRADPGVIQWIIDSRYAGSKAQATNGLDAEQAATVQALLDQGVQTVDTAARAEVYAELQDYLIDDALVFPFAERVQLAGVSSAVHGFRFTSEAFGDFADTWIQP